MKRKILLSPSVMCTDLVDLKSSIRALEEAEIDALHIDVIDGTFSPAMPLGLDTIKRLRDITTLDFDVHIMARDNEFFVQKMLDIGVQRVSFHYETALHADRLVSRIKQHGVKAGMALNPATPLSSCEWLLPELDNVLLMLINPGYADNPDEQQVTYAAEKVRKLAELIKPLRKQPHIQVDGRVSFATIPGLIAAGADDLVLGSTSLYRAGHSLAENRQALRELIQQSGGHA